MRRLILCCTRDALTAGTDGLARLAFAVVLLAYDHQHHDDGQMNQGEHEQLSGALAVCILMEPPR